MEILEAGTAGHCWGTNHAFQWRTRREWNAAGDTARAHNLPEPDCDGGVGHTRNAVPNEVCPECDGYGRPKVWIKDLHSLTNGDRALIKSVDKIRYGPRYRFHDRQMALSVLARHLRIGTNQPIVASPATVSNALAEMQSRGAKFT